MKRTLHILLFGLFFLPYLAGQDIGSLADSALALPTDTHKVNRLNYFSYQMKNLDPAKAMKLATDALSLSKELNYPEGIADAHINLGLIYLDKSYFDFASEDFFACLELAEKTNDGKRMARAYNSIGILYIHLGQLDKSFEYLSRSLELNTEIGDQRWIAANYNNLGMVYERKGEIDRAIENYTTSLSISERLGNKRSMANSCGNLGSAYLKKNNPVSLYYFKRRLDITDELNDITGIASTHELIGEYYVSQGNYTLAEEHLLQAFTTSNSQHILQVKLSSAAKLSDLYERMKQYELAYKYHVLAKQEADSINSLQSILKITTLEMEHLWDKEQKLNRLEQEKEKLQYVLIAGLMVLIVAAVGMLYARQRIHTKHERLKMKNLELEKVRLEEELNFKKNELSSNVGYLLKMNELITWISERLASFRDSKTEENSRLLQGIINDLKSALNQDIWNEFELHFKEVNKDFYDRLKTLIPNLTANDLKLCAFLRLNMTSSEISAITGQSVKSLEVARSRLRKKFNLTSSERTLADFLAQF
jgi:tetratricopeptide (TPR) repeat protein